MSQTTTPKITAGTITTTNPTPRDITTAEVVPEKQCESPRAIIVNALVGEVPMTFIRAPYVESVEDGVKVLAEVDGNIVGVEYGKQMGFAFHPELDGDLRIHQRFVDKI